ncbi:MAG: FAD-binding oxidoreductase [Actinomycetota bacterium]
MDLGGLVAALPEGTCVVDPELVARYAHDVTGRFSGTPAAVVRPTTTGEVAAVLKVCARDGIGVVPQGGNTGLVGGAIASSTEIVLSLERLTRVDEVDRASGTVVAEAGATLEAVRSAAQAQRLEFPIDFAARGSATIGGMVATDAGGALVMRYGTMRDLVVGLQVVLADGTIVDHLHRPPKDSSGFDVTRLIPGSEGTLAVVTAARLKLVPLLEHRTVAVIAVASLEGAVTVAAHLCREVTSVEAVDFFLEAGLQLVRRHAQLPALFPNEHAAYLVVSCAAHQDPSEELGAALARYGEARDVAVGQSAQQHERLWSYRELHNEAINAAGVPHKLDVAVVPARVPELIARVDRWLSDQRPHTHAIYYGHLADGNVHVNILEAAPDDDAIDEAVLRIVAGMDGSISAEHGIGRAKNRWLHLTRSPGEIAAMAAVKRALDPEGVLNPNKLLPPPA